MKRSRSEEKETFTFTPMWVLAPCLGLIGVVNHPPSTQAEFCWFTCLQTSAPTPQKSYAKFQNTRTSFDYPFWEKSIGTMEKEREPAKLRKSWGEFIIFYQFTKKMKFPLNWRIHMYSSLAPAWP
jgi:hypothetical protein